VVVPTGTRTPWREIHPERDLPPEFAVFIRDGHASESADLLAEALRADGIVRTLGRALPIAENASLERRWYGFVDEGDDPRLCTQDGETSDGECVDDVFECVVAIVDTTEH
jgi:hypothetical protein